MKKMILNVFAMLAIVLTATSCDKEKMIQENDLPTRATAFLSENFSSMQISHVKSEKEGLSGKEYSVYFNEGTEVTFDKKGDWIKVEGAGNTPIPTGFITKSIVDYVKEKYPNAAINSIEKNRKTFEVELTNELDLVFNSDGSFLRVD